MTSQVMNKISKRKYGELMSSVQAVRLVLDDAEKLLADYTDGCLGVSDWQHIPDGEEMKGLYRKALDSMEVFHREVKEWEIKLVADGWKV